MQEGKINDIKKALCEIIGKPGAEGNYPQGSVSDLVTRQGKQAQGYFILRNALIWAINEGKGNEELLGSMRDVYSYLRLAREILAPVLDPDLIQEDLPPDIRDFAKQVLVPETGILPEISQKPVVTPPAVEKKQEEILELPESVKDDTTISTKPRLERSTEKPGVPLVDLYWDEKEIAWYSGPDEKRVRKESEKFVKKITPVVRNVLEIAAELVSLSPEEMRQRTENWKKDFQERTVEKRRSIDVLRERCASEKNRYKKASLKANLAKAERELFKLEERILAEYLPEAFAMASAAIYLEFGYFPHPEQIAAAIALNNGIPSKNYDRQRVGIKGTVVEQRTGEGKTLTAVLPLYLNALTSQPAHLATANDYLARVGAGWMGPVYERLGLTVGVVSVDSKGQPLTLLYDSAFLTDKPTVDPRLNHFRTCTVDEKGQLIHRQVFSADIIYASSTQLGFTYLRDNISSYRETQSGMSFRNIIVDEVDSVLIDEAQTPLIIAGEGELKKQDFIDSINLARILQKGVHYIVREKERICVLTDEGIVEIEKQIGLPEGQSIYDEDHVWILPLINNALSALNLFIKDKDYIVEDGRIVILNALTGHKMPGKSWQGGLHQAIEAKEGVELTTLHTTIAEISYQNFFRQFKKLAGMTGTASTVKKEFEKVYGLTVISLPKHKLQGKEFTSRIDERDEIFMDGETKWQTIIDDIISAYNRGQPVLVGVFSPQKAEWLSSILTEKGVFHGVLTAKNDYEEALVVAQAGRLGKVTIVTSIAGRGVDIMLGGNPEILAYEELKKQGVDISRPIDPELWERVYRPIAEDCLAQKAKAAQLGGLRVLVTEPFTDRRVDNQLRGRSGRQSDPGVSKLFLSFDDEILKIAMLETEADDVDMVTGKKPKKWKRFLVNYFRQAGQGTSVSGKFFEKKVREIRERRENFESDIRASVLAYDDVLKVQREFFYGSRQKIIDQVSTLDFEIDCVRMFAQRAIQNLLAKSRDKKNDDLVFEVFIQSVRSFMPVTFEQESLWHQLLTENDRAKTKNVTSVIAEEIVNFYIKSREDQIDKIRRMIADGKIRPRIQGLEVDAQKIFQDRWRQIMLKLIDSFWTWHLEEMEDLKSGIGLRAVGQQNPLFSYQIEGSRLYREGIENLKSKIGEVVFYSLIFLDRPKLSQGRQSTLITEDVRKPEGIEKKDVSEKSREVDRDEEYSIMFWKHTKERGLNSEAVREQMLKSLEVGIQSGIFSIFVNVRKTPKGEVDFDEETKEKLSAYRMLAKEKGYSIGPFQYHEKSGTAQAQITRT